MLDIFQGKVTARDWVFVGVVLAVTLLLLATFYLLVVRREDGKIAQCELDRAALAKELGNAKKIAANIDQLREESLQMQRLDEVFQQRLPAEREIPTLLNRFEQMGKECNLRVELVTMPTKNEERLETIPYKVTAMGRFHQILSFINKLERYERYLMVSAVDIGEEKEGVSEATFVLSTFRIKSEEAPKEGASTPEKGAKK